MWSGSYQVMSNLNDIRQNQKTILDTECSASIFLRKYLWKMGTVDLKA